MSEIFSSYAYFDSPIGKLLVAGDAQALRLISFPTGRRAREPQAGWRNEPKLFAEAFRQLHDYFEGRRTAFALPLMFHGTDFQNSVWTGLQSIAYGETQSYRQLATVIGRPSACRAVGAANGANPLPIVIPCHRVIGASGALTGFGGGIETKQFLLAHEQRVLKTGKVRAAKVA